MSPGSPAPLVISVSSLHLYPIKSCRGVTVAEAELDAFGLVGDRRFLLVDPDGNFYTQRAEARMALITASLENGGLLLRAPVAGEFRLPLDDRASASVRPVAIWRDVVDAVDLGDPVAAWCSIALGQPCRLVRTTSNFSRRLPSQRIPAAHAEVLAEVPVAFVDAFPLLVISEASLEHLNAKLAAPLPMNRFRPNVVVRGAAPHDEDRWKIVRIGGVEFRAGAPCGRCVITTTDQETGKRGVEPLPTLAKYRRDDKRGTVNFGRYWMHRGPGTIRVGDEVEIVA